MRVLSDAMKALLTSGEHVEPVTIIKIYWNDNYGPAFFHADRDIPDPGNPSQVKIPGSIIEMGPFDESQRSDSTGAAGSVTITLDDRGGDFKAIFDIIDIHLKRVDIFQSFMGLADPSADKLLVFSGQISTPIVWDEGKRTMTFSVVTKLEGWEVGFSADMGASSGVAMELVGKPWPMVFGTVHHSPCLRLQNIPTAFTTEPFAIVDKTVDARIKMLNDLLTEVIGILLVATNNAIDDTGSPLAFGKLDEVYNDPEVKKYTKMQVDIQDQITELKAATGWQTPFAGTHQVGLIPTVFVTQPYSGLFRVGNGLFDGTLNGESGVLVTTPRMLPGSPAGPDLREGFEFYNAGTQVAIAGPYPLKFVASVVPGTVYKVWAMRSWNGLRQMAEVPKSYYDISTQTLGHGMTATYITLKQPLSTVAMIQNLKTQLWENSFGKNLPPHLVNQVDWEDEIYVSFTSSVGPNAVSIMEWLINNFSSNSYDANSFNAVSGLVGGLPMNFTLSETPDVMSLLQDIAYQARCLIYLRDDIFFLTFLPRFGDYLGNLGGIITEDDVMVDSLKVTTTPTESLVTKYVATFRPDYSPFFSEPVKVLLRYGIPKYGVHEESHDYFCYNFLAAVQAAATFWLTRKSQSWKIFQARLLITRLDLEVFDYVLLNFIQPYVADEPVVGLITRCVYDSANKWVDVEIWCPVILGEMKTNSFAYPASATEIVEWPQYHQLAGGGGGSLSSPALPPSNPRTEPSGVTDLGGFHGFSGSAPSFVPYQTGGGWAPPLPLAIPRSKSFPATPLPVDDPTQDYKYKTPPDPSVPDLTGVFPGRIHYKMGPDPHHPEVTRYKVYIYQDGLDRAPKERTVGQLQIDPDDSIPRDTWTEVVVNQGTREDKSIFFERTMQLPVWME